MQNDAPSLLDAIDEFVVLHGMSPITFGRLAMKDPHFVRDIRGGRRVWPETDAKIRAFMANHVATAEQKEAA
ncbi:MULTISPECIES: hypothetical protein [unclassified Sphingomonas]|uniref:hypothetical protein n=1 Tax=unclassified Sphingomonas TaxID=196159 RepID=UPI00177BCC16|nr:MULTISPECIES: hypothetical protein [unclassified Sphingomonas]MBD8638251.1 hypothetical protein [Sphingomonas sp. CFBP 13733]MBD8699773.1 hypothetical protein [Sphingomonas sp. CFBP 13714]